jgi:DtxR family Mn-dependent transcriptional regulator
MSSVSKTRYLQTILELGGGNAIKVSNKAIAEHLQVTPASVSDMLTRLKADGDVDVTPYHGVSLTDQGRKTALKLIRSHRLFEVFLHEKLGLSMAQAHENADNLDHESSEEVTERLAEFLGHPDFSPTGTPIPDREGTYHHISGWSRLSQREIGDKITIEAFVEDSALLTYIEVMHLERGSQWLIAQQMSFDGSFVLQNLADEHNQKEISAKVADAIYTTLISD